jgi:hypothetical protein
MELTTSFFPVLGLQVCGAMPPHPYGVVPNQAFFRYMLMLSHNRVLLINS